ncbi:hypothetical protein BGLA2_450022 [Burkholderia gladioli]|nr:hypothetical protein BGLA2_450022 [Burkholderia gladioli]
MLRQRHHARLASEKSKEIKGLAFDWRPAPASCRCGVQPAPWLARAGNLDDTPLAPAPRLSTFFVGKLVDILLSHTTSP